jgi:hypothetical protein
MLCSGLVLRSALWIRLELGEELLLGLKLRLWLGYF